jgi:hypothetical protein
MSKKRFLLLAVVLGVFVASTAMAQNTYNMLNYADFSEYVSNNSSGTVLNPEGKGDVLLFPYFDVRVVNGKAQETYFAIINEDFTDEVNHGVAAKLRFREWDKSEEVFDADIWLSKNDVWVGVLTRNAANGLTRITSPDYVITDYDSDSNGAWFVVSTPLAGGFDFFTTFVPGGSKNTRTPPTGFTSADLTNMGYFEVIGEERTVSKAVAGTAGTWGVGTTRVTRLDPFNDPYPNIDCPNSLSGYAYIVRVADGIAMGYNASAIANFTRDYLFSLFVGPGDIKPDLSDGDEGLAELEFELSKAILYHGYSIENSINAAFSLIVTLPTKHFHFGGRPNYTLGLKSVAYPEPFTGEHANYGEKIGVHIFDRNENPYEPEEGWWSPRDKPTIVLPWEVNVIGLYQSQGPSLPAIGQRNNVGFTTGGFDSGWLWLDLSIYDDALGHYVHLVEGVDTLFDHLGHYFWGYHGLPALSLALQEFSNGNVGGYYGAIFPAFYEVSWDLYEI